MYQDTTMQKISNEVLRITGEEPCSPRFAGFSVLYAQGIDPGNCLMNNESLLNHLKAIPSRSMTGWVPLDTARRRDSIST